MESAVDGADKSDGGWVGDVLWFCGKSGVDDTLGSDLCGGFATLCSVVGQTGFHKERVGTVSLCVACLAEAVSCV